MAEPEITRRVRQQEIVADYALLALREGTDDRLGNEACVCAARGLSAPLAKILRYQPKSDDFRFLNAFGLDPAAAGLTSLGSGRRSPAGHVLRTGLPLVCGDASGIVGDQPDPPFRLPRQLREQGIRSAIVVPVCEAPRISADAGGHAAGDIWGVLEVDSPAASAFNRDDVAFLRTLASILTAGRQAHRRAAALQHSEAFAGAVLDACPDCVEVLDRQGRVTRINSNGLRVLELDATAALLGQLWVAQWPQEQRRQATQALARARADGSGRFSATRPDRNGTPRWWDVQLAPMPGQGVVAVSRDVTAQALATRAKDAALREKDLMMLEVHHRVKNSLQLVQNLLSLQARNLGDEESASRLEDSAARVRTIAAIHDRLYRAGATLDVEIGPYLEGLIEDLQSALVESGAARRITLVADAACWAASDVPTIGLVLTELITNSLKYGAGQVSVSFRQPPGERAVLTVEDEGPGPDPGFDPARSRGLGMRLVTGLLRGEGARLEIDRGAGHARFIAHMPSKQVR